MNDFQEHCALAKNHKFLGLNLTFLNTSLSVVWESSVEQMLPYPPHPSCQFENYCLQEYVGYFVETWFLIPTSDVFFYELMLVENYVLLTVTLLIGHSVNDF